MARRRPADDRTRWNGVSNVPVRPEAVVGARGGQALEAMRVPADPWLGPVVERGDVRLDVQERCAIEHVDVGDPERRALDPQQAYRREADRIRARRGAGGEDPARVIVE